MANKQLMSSAGYGFGFATTLTGFHFAVTALVGMVSNATGYSASKHVPLWELLWFSIVANMSITGMNLSLMLNSVGFYQTPTQRQQPLAPQLVQIRPLTSGRLSLSFRDYREVQTPLPNRQQQPAGDVDHEEFAGMLRKSPYEQACQDLLNEERAKRAAIAECQQFLQEFRRKKAEAEEEQTRQADAYKKTARHFLRRSRIDWDQEGDHQQDKEAWAVHTDTGKYQFMVRMTQPPRHEDIQPSGWGMEDDIPPPKWDTSPTESAESSDKPNTGNNGYIEAAQADSDSSEFDTSVTSTQQSMDCQTLDSDHHQSEIAYTAAELPETEYPILRRMAKQHNETALSSAQSGTTSTYRPPQEPVMGPVTYPPAQKGESSKAGLSWTGATYKGRAAPFGNEMYQLPSAQQNTGALLVLPEDIGQYGDVITRWETITLNWINGQTWASAQAKVNAIENLLGEIEKKIWIQWRTAYSEEYEQLVGIADDPQNVISQIRRIILLEDPYQGSTEEQNRAYRDLDRLSCDKMKDIFSYMNQYKILAVKSGRSFISEELSEKFFRKMPSLVGPEIEKAFMEKYPGTTIAVLPRIHFAYQYLAEAC